MEEGPAAADPAVATTPEKEGTDWWAELRAIFWLILAVLTFHSLIAKPFYIPSESMMPGLLKGDRLVVSKYPYGWSWVSPSLSHPAALDRPAVGRDARTRRRGHRHSARETSDYIKRVVGVPGDTIEMAGGLLIINGQPVRRERREDAMLPIDDNLPMPARHVRRPPRHRPDGSGLLPPAHLPRDPWPMAAATTRSTSAMSSKSTIFPARSCRRATSS
jgi:signal peptidase I